MKTLPRPIPEPIAGVLERHRSQGVVLDVPLALLSIAGTEGAEMLASLPALAGFTAGDYFGLKRLSEPFERVVTTPNILTEVGASASALEGPLRTRFFAALKRFVEAVDERVVTSSIAVLNPLFAELGLTGCGICALAKRDGLVVLTTDRRLADHLDLRLCAVVAFDDVRPTFGR